jgi:hypothetical protein
MKSKKNATAPEEKRYMLAIAMIALMLLLAVTAGIYVAGMAFLVLVPYFYKKQIKCLKKEGRHNDAKAFERALERYNSGKAYKVGLALGLVVALAIILFVSLLAP